MALDELIVTGRIADDGSGVDFDFTTMKLYGQLLKEWASRGRDANIIISLIYDKRSNNMNNYYWGVVVNTIREFTLETQGKTLEPYDIHLYIETSVLGNKIKEKEVLGETVFYLEGTKIKDMNTKQFSKAIIKIQQFYGPKGCYIPEPE